MNAICLVIDRLHVGHVGAYGNTWMETPALDRLAAEGFVLDQALIDSPQLEALYRSYWLGWHALCTAEPSAQQRSLPALLRQAGVTTALLTDERLVGRHALAVEFDEVFEIDPPWQPQICQQIEQTHFAQCFVQAIDWLESAREPFLLWAHLGGLGMTWDAPPRFRRTYWERGDPPQSDSADVPDRVFPQDCDPDEILPFSQTYAGQVSLLDTCLGALWEFLAEGAAGRQTLLVLTSARGFPLGEHGRVGPCDEALYAELVHVPWLLRFPDGRGAAQRSQSLVEPADLWATLLDWWGITPLPPAPTAASLVRLLDGGPGPLRDRLCVAGSGTERAIRTPAWYLRAATQPELFAKPDDRWDANNVTIRCQEVVECLLDALAACQQTLQSGRLSDLPPLSEVLVSGLD